MKITMSKDGLITMSKDGLPRVNFKIITRLSLNDFGTYFTVYLMDEIKYYADLDENDEKHEKRIKREARDIIKNMSAKQIREKITDVILEYGLSNPAYTVSDEGLSDLADYVQELLAKRFKGFSKTKG